MINYRAQRPWRTQLFDCLCGVFRFVVLAAAAYCIWFGSGVLRHTQVEKNTHKVFPSDEPNDITEPDALVYPSAAVAITDDPNAPKPPSQYYPFPEDERAYLESILPKGRIRFAGLLDINDQVWGTIEIPGVMEKQPFVQAADNDFYLHRNIERKDDSYGTVFMDYRNDPFLMNRNTLLYGHHMKGGAMFGSLGVYKGGLDAIQKHHVIHLDTLVGKMTYIVYAAYVCEKDYGYLDLGENKKNFKHLLKEIKSRNQFTSDLDVNTDDRILTLSTCDYDFTDARFVVHARRLRPGEAIPDVTFDENTDIKSPEHPNEQPLDNVTFNRPGVATDANSSKTYYYDIVQPNEDSPRALVYYVGDSETVQGPYPLLADVGKMKSVAAWIAPTGGKTVLALSDGDKTKLFEADLPYHEPEALRTFENVADPVLTTDDDSCRLLCAQKNKDGGTVIVAADLDGGNRRELYTIESDSLLGGADVRPLFAVTVKDEQVLLVQTEDDVFAVRKKVLPSEPLSDVGVDPSPEKSPAPSKKTTPAPSGKSEKSEKSSAAAPSPVPTWQLDPAPLNLDANRRIVLYGVRPEDGVLRVCTIKDGTAHVSKLDLTAILARPVVTATPEPTVAPSPKVTAKPTAKPKRRAISKKQGTRFVYPVSTGLTR